MSVSLISRRWGRVAMSVAALALMSPARAADKPATPEGAEALLAFFAKFLPSLAEGAPPFVTVQPDGSNYVVSANLVALNGLLKSAGSPAAYDAATLVYKLAEQDDGNWRVVQDAFPRIVSRTGDMTTSVDIFNYAQTIVINPKLAWWLSGEGKAEKGVFVVHSPQLDESIDFGPLTATYATTPSANGAISTSVKEAIDDIGFKVTAVGKDGAPSNASGRVDKVTFNLGADALKSRKVFDLVALLNAHREDLAQHEVELKGLLRDLAEPGLKIAEGGEAAKILFSSLYGAVALSGARGAFAVSNQGPESAIDVALGLEGLSLPVGVAPPGASDLIPTKVDLVVTLKGFDIAAGANEAIADMHLGGPGPVLSEENQAKVAQALLGAGPLRINLAPSHIVAPALDADLEGEVRYIVGKASGSMTIHMRNFDKTMAAIKALGPDIASKSLPAVAMAKGLATTESDGSLSWIIEVADDRSISVNGIPLGKAPTPN